MTQTILASVDQNGRLSLSKQTHGAIEWLFESDSVTCAIEVGEPGLVEVQPLARWATQQGLTEAEARQRLDDAWNDPEDTEHTHAFSRDTTRTSSGSSSTGRLLPLPHMALLALFEQGTGPLKPKRGKGFTSGSVLVVVRSQRFELWSRDSL